jgi:hypothetical protein
LRIPRSRVFLDGNEIGGLIRIAVVLGTVVEANVECIVGVGIVNLYNDSTVVKIAAVVDLTNELAVVALAVSYACDLIRKPSQLPVLGVVEAHSLLVRRVRISHES